MRVRLVVWVALLAAAGVSIGAGAAIAAGADRTATNDADGRKVLLRSSGSWVFLDAAGQRPQGEEAAAGATKPGDEAAATPPQGAAATPPQPDGAREPVAPAAQNPEGWVAQRLQQLRGMDRQLLLTIGATAGSLVLLVAVLLLYFLYIQPAKRRRLLKRALAIIAADDKNRFEEAENLLNEAITAGLRDADVKEAYFARAYVYAALGMEDGAIANLKKADRSESAVLYLELWTRVKQKRYEEAVALCDSSAQELGTFANGKMLMSIAMFNRATELWKKREVNEAVKHFDRVRELGIHADKLPPSSGDYHTTLGIVALFDAHIDEAKTHFETALKETKDKVASIEAELGLLLCAWRKKEDPTVIDTKLGRLTAALPVSSKADAAKKDGELTDSALLGRNALLWHAVSLIQGWLRLAEKSGLPRESRDALEKRLAKVLAIDSKMPDPKLLLGLVDYYLFHGSAKAQAVARMTDAGIDVPEVNLLVERENKIAQAERNLLQTFFGMVKSYVGNHEVPKQMRQRLIDSLHRFDRFRTLERELSVVDTSEEAGATLAGLQTRGAILTQRVERIVKPALASQGPEKVKSLDDLLGGMKSAAKAIQENATRLEKQELELMVNTGEFLLREEGSVAVTDAGGPAKLLRASPVERVAPLPPVPGRRPAIPMPPMPPRPPTSNREQ